MEWEPASEDEIRSLTASEAVRMEPSLFAFWESVKIQPVKWSLPPWGDSGGGFWVVGVIGQHCIWFNDIEDGFNTSRFDSFGRIAEYWCNQSTLIECLSGKFESMMQAIAASSITPISNCRPPEKIPWLECPSDWP